jgi:hypothetical protein
MFLRVVESIDFRLNSYRRYSRYSPKKSPGKSASPGFLLPDDQVLFQAISGRVATPASVAALCTSVRGRMRVK